ncbi:hypothetical protein [Ancylobacter amanitiformis]|uniref:Uncharacterized protein n=1 Tax=Ancylobacter amanitiformis TaxID=217069 RepID=A0ABU0LTZ5_9HYPH|nr:hypothetical protein [Ancylobacter amanitiformis]MDQ0512100.1 hypothetical protein [Ancylobacter amanitiformis]
MSAPSAIANYLQHGMPDHQLQLILNIRFGSILGLAQPACAPAPETSCRGDRNVIARVIEAIADLQESGRLETVKRPLD